MRRFAETVPNNGLIRYYGFLSQERILITSVNGFKEVFGQMGYDFTKTFPMKFAISRFTGEGLGYSEGDEHRVCCIWCSSKMPDTSDNGFLASTQAFDAGILLPAYQEPVPHILEQRRGDGRTYPKGA